MEVFILRIKRLAMKKYVLVALMGLANTAVLAQTETDSLQNDLVMIARSYGDSIILRWAPTSYHVWQLGNKHGYVLERWHAGMNRYERIAGPILPYTLAEWKAKTDTTDVTVSIAAEVLHGERAVDPAASDAMGRKIMAHQEQNNRLAFALMAADFSAPVSKALGLRYSDKDLKGHKRFIYRLYIPYAGEKIDTAKLYVDANHVYEPFPVREVRAEGKDLSIEISWNKPLNDQLFSAYYIEKSEDGKGFRRLNERPFRSDDQVAEGLLHLYQDSVETNGKTYWYRVIGLTSFGDEGVVSAVVSAEAKDLTPPAPPVVVTSKETSDHKVLIEWKTDAGESDHAGFYGLKSTDNVNSGFVQIAELKSNARSFTDPNPSAFRPNYYKVVAFDMNKNQSESMITMTLLRDDTPPATPTGLIGEIDSLGIVSFAWDLGKEEDLKGYRVYRANGRDREFIQITKGPIPGNFYTDTVSLTTIGKKVYYKVAAFDFNYNPSGYSEILELERPDYHPPVKPVMKQPVIKEDTIQLHWTRSTSDDVVRHILFRGVAGAEWQPVATLTDSASIYYDTNIEFDGRYSYAIEAIDVNGLTSGKSIPVNVRFRNASMKSPVSGLAGEFSKDTKNFILSWQYGGEGKFKFVIFRGEGNGDLVPYGSVPGTERQFQDLEFFLNEGGYSYAVKVLFEDGTESGLSEKLTVSFKN
jgi:hypothetical protein